MVGRSMVKVMGREAIGRCKLASDERLQLRLESSFGSNWGYVYVP